MKRLPTLSLVLAFGLSAGAAQAQDVPSAPETTMPSDPSNTAPEPTMTPAPEAIPPSDEPFDDTLEPTDPADSLEPDEVAPYPDGNADPGTTDDAYDEGADQPAPEVVEDPLNPSPDGPVG